MTRDERIEKIIEDSLLAIINGQETIETVLERYPKEASAIRPEIEAALWLADTGKSLDPRPGFIASSRHYLEQRIAAAPPHTPWRRLVGRYTPQRWVFNLIAPLILIIILVLVVNSFILTARLSIPGEPLYSSKLVIEDVQVALTFNPENKTDLYIQFTRERATEFVELVLEGNYDQLPSTADRMETDLIAALRSLDKTAMYMPAAKMSLVTDMHDTLSNEIILLNVLKSTSPSSTRAEIDLAIQVALSGVMALR